MAGTAVTASMTPASNKTGQSAVAARKFGVSDIPDAMRKMHWPVAADLMDHWFKGKPWDTENGGMDELTKDHKKPVPTEYLETSIIKMDWLMKFDRANKIQQDLKGKWNSRNATVLMQIRFTEKFANSPPGRYPIKFDGKAIEAEKFGATNTLAVIMDQYKVGSVDELRAALANFNLRVIAEGEVIIADKKIEFFVNRLGFYAEDSYDFTDGNDASVSQPLGFWNFDGIANPAAALASNTNMASMQASVSENPAISPEDMAALFQEVESQRYYLVQNNDFVEYRAQHGKGGDFRIFSDIQYEDIPRTLVEISS